MTETNALHSLYGGKVSRKALAGNVGVKAEKREQTVFTPRWLVKQLNPVYPTLDPCTTADNPLECEHFFTEETDGMEHNWASGGRGWAFVNPPYADLQDWMRVCQFSADVRDIQHCKSIMLIPFRPQRAWFNTLCKGREVASLAPFPFVGHKSAFPAPLCLVGYGMPLPNSIKMPMARGKTKELILGKWSVK
jgi:phage N-6-adenine-methyltransferase